MHEKSISARVRSFCEAYDLRLPILLAPMAGSCPPALSIAIAKAGGMGACGALPFGREQILKWAQDVRAGSNGTFQINLWIPEPAPPHRNETHETAVRAFLKDWGPEVPAEDGDVTLASFEAQCDAVIDAGPSVISSIMGVYPPEIVARFKERNISWFANVTTVKEAELVVEAGADVVITQGMEAGGHRGAFIAEEASINLVGLFSLLPAVVDAVDVPVIATGGIADGRGIAAALALGASAVQIGTGFLRTPEAQLAEVWADAISTANPEETCTTRAYSGRLGRSLATNFVKAANDPQNPEPAAYPVQRGLTTRMKAEAAKTNNLHGMQAWAGQSAKLARAEPAGELIQSLWDEAEAILGGVLQ